MDSIDKLKDTYSGKSNKKIDDGECSRSKLDKTMKDTFSEEELSIITSKLGISYDEIIGELDNSFNLIDKITDVCDGNSTKDILSALSFVTLHVLRNTYSGEEAIEVLERIQTAERMSFEKRLNKKE